MAEIAVERTRFNIKKLSHERKVLDLVENGVNLDIKMIKSSREMLAGSENDFGDNVVDFNHYQKMTDIRKALGLVVNSYSRYWEA